MSTATGNRISRRDEKNTAELATQSRPDVDMMTADLDREDIVIAEDDIPTLKKKYMADLAFNEEPMTIRISGHSRDKDSPKNVACWVNGKGIELLVNGKFISLGYIPIGSNVTTKRKYVENLMTSAPVTVNTVVGRADVEQPTQSVTFERAAEYSVSIIRDDNPAGSDWAEAVMFRRA